jgi:SAM-dependent methyltransferase
LKLDKGSNHFDEYYYSVGCGRPYRRDPEWLDFFNGIADRIVREIAPKSVLDVGCAMGFLVEALRDRGVEAFGIDISEYAINQVREDIQPYCKVASITEPLENKFDLIVTIETFEHLSQKDVVVGFENLVNASEDIVFSSSPSDYGEATHRNIQPPEYWALQFAQFGYYREFDYDPTFITDWAVRYRKGRDPLSRIVADYERMLWRLVQQSNSERELILQQRQFLSENTSTLEMLHKNLKRIVSDGNLDTAEALVAALEQLMGKIDELDLAKDEGRESDTGPGL